MEVMALLLIGFLVVYLPACLLTGFVAKTKNRSLAAWTMIALCLSPLIGLIAAAAAGAKPLKEPKPRRRRFFEVATPWEAASPQPAQVQAATQDAATPVDDHIRFEDIRPDLRFIAFIGLAIVAVVSAIAIFGNPGNGKGPESRAIASPASTARAAEDVRLSVDHAQVRPWESGNELIQLDVTVLRRNGEPDATATLAAVNFTLTAHDGATYAFSGLSLNEKGLGFGEKKNCTHEVALPASGSRSCTILFVVPEGVRAGSLSWGRLAQTEASTAFLIEERREPANPQASAELQH